MNQAVHGSPCVVSLNFGSSLLSAVSKEGLHRISAIMISIAMTLPAETVVTSAHAARFESERT